MNIHELQVCYYEWLTNKVFRFTHEVNAYSKLLNTLYEFEYTYCLDHDSNRYNDGLELKKTFCWEVGLDPVNVKSLGNKCSILEMMVALAVRCEVSIMSDPDFGDRTWLWFKSMLESMRLNGQTDDIFDRTYVEQRLEIMLSRSYDEYGDGALFKVDNPAFDMKNAEVWTQLNWFLSEKY